MKRILLSSTLAVTLAASVAFCQQSSQPAQSPSNDATSQQPSGQYGHRHHRPFDPQKAAEHLGKRLGLSADQTAKLAPIFADQQQKMAQLRSDTSLTPDQKRQQFRTIHQETQSQLAGVLTPEQLQQLHSMRRPRGGHHQQPQQPDSATPPSAS